jgi:hypothetical protein
VVLFLAGIWLLWAFGYETVAARLTTQVDGVVISSRDVPPSRGSRYITEYTLRDPSGHNQLYVASPTDASLPRSMPAGTSLKKFKWHLDYERDGQPIDNFPKLFYGSILGIALGCLTWSILLWRKKGTPK